MKKFLFYFAMVFLCIAIACVVMLSVPAYFYIKNPQEMRVKVEENHRNELWFLVCSLDPIRQIEICSDFAKVSPTMASRYMTCMPDKNEYQDEKKAAKEVEECAEAIDKDIHEKYLSKLKGKTLIIHFE